jgi:hypothetical protein
VTPLRTYRQSIDFGFGLESSNGFLVLGVLGFRRFICWKQAPSGWSKRSLLSEKGMFPHLPLWWLSNSFFYWPFLGWESNYPKHPNNCTCRRFKHGIRPPGVTIQLILEMSHGRRNIRKGVDLRFRPFYSSTQALFFTFKLKVGQFRRPFRPVLCFEFHFKWGFWGLGFKIVWHPSYSLHIPDQLFWKMLS